MTNEISCREFWLESRNKLRFARLWLPSSGDVVAMVCLVHGLGEHSERYTDFAAAMANEHFGTLAIDLEGHGRSPGWRGCVDSFDGLMVDIESSVRWLSTHYPNSKIILYGHSMGGNLVLNYALRKHPLPAVVIASGSFLRPTRPPSELYLLIAKLISKILPHYRLVTPVHAEGLTRDREQRAAWRRDELIHRYLSLRLGDAVLEAGRWAIEHADELTIPALIIHGSADELTCPKASEEFAGNGGPHCTLKIFQGLLHDIHREVERDEVIAFMVDWVKQHLQNKTATV